MKKWVGFDAFGTLFKIHPSVGYQYRKVIDSIVGRSNPLTEISDQHLSKQILAAIKQENLKNPNYGGDKGEVCSSKWWERVFCTAMNRLDIPLDTFTDKHENKCSQHILEALFHHFSTSLPYKVHPFAHETLQALRQAGYRLFVLSNCDERLQKILTSLNLTSYFELVLDSKTLGLSKPAQECYAAVEKKISLLEHEPFKIYYIGDDEKNDGIGPSGRRNWYPIILDINGTSASNRTFVTVGSLNDILSSIKTNVSQ